MDIIMLEKGNNMRYRNILFLVETPILTRYIDRYGIRELREQGFFVTIIDLSPYLLPITYKSIRSDLCDYEKEGFIRIFNLKAYQQYLDKFRSENTLVICSMGYRWEYRKVFRELKSRGIHFCYFMQEMSNTDATKEKKSIIKRLSISNLKSFVTRRIPLKYQNIPYADFIIGCGGEKNALDSYKKARLCTDQTPVYFFHSSNYEECLINNNPNRFNYKYAVFVDQFLPFHTDNLDAGIKIEPSIYYERLNAFFDYVEDRYNLKIVVAAHPRSNYEDYDDCFKGRAVIKNDTCTLIKYSEFVIYHFSNSLGYLAIYKKPVIVISTEEVYYHFGESIDSVCDCLGVKRVDIDHISEVDSINLDECIKNIPSIYEEYIRNYMKKEYTGKLEGERLWVQIGKFIKGMS